MSIHDGWNDIYWRTVRIRKKEDGESTRFLIHTPGDTVYSSSIRTTDKLTAQQIERALHSLASYMDMKIDFHKERRSVAAMIREKALWHQENMRTEPFDDEVDARVEAAYLMTDNRG